MHGLGPEIIFYAFGFPFANTFITTLLVDVVLLVFVFLIARNISTKPGKLQAGTELIISYFYDLTTQVAGNVRVKSIFPWVVSFFIVIFFSNLFGLLPGVGTVGILHNGEHGPEIIPVLRPSTSDFNTTLALAVVSFVSTHAIAIKYNGLKGYASHFFNFSSLSLAPIFLFVGLLEVVSEFVKLFSLSFRLFGNIFAGEVVLSTISNIFAFIAPIPFLMLESIVAVVQALVFAMLTMAFMSALSAGHEGGEH